MWTLLQLLSVAAVTVLSFLAGAALKPYLSGYSKKKGENLATQGDIGKLVEQVQAATKATEEIKTEISGGLWDRQKRWEIKRQVLFQLVRRISVSYGVLTKLDVILKSGIANSSHDTPFQMNAKVEENTKWFKALAAIDESRLFVAVSCNKNVGDALLEYRKLASEIAAKIFENDAEILKQKNPELLKHRNNLLDAIRRDLGIEITPQSK